ncbi:hydroxyisourate hydrolase [Paenibacillus glycanilyticus]|uniref:5-hydroxyisourate hydrolase n=1 Tax=Paenibacillus glycanilyticus TaxID=126569 RepID=A0ABQ6NT55_9BACL|nr:hydroxyisourate hydrolase [Paenibacillus glycanilyticus]GMK48271.1 5-hydroxyisourate hydrolase [Paenibacillus glycanilyticus]
MSGGRITTHVLDTSKGKPAVGIKVELYLIESDVSSALPEERILLRSAATNEDGRLDAPLLGSEEMLAAVYEIVFCAGDYFRDEKRRHILDSEPVFDRIPIRFSVTDAGSHYHIPLLVAPGGYSTYRGS